MGVRPILWKVVRDAGGTEAGLRALLAGATAEQMILLHSRLTGAAMLLWLDALQPRYPAPPEGLPLAHWIVSQGKAAYERAEENPQAFAAPPPADAPDLPGVVQRVYRERFGADIPNKEPDPAGRTDLGPTPEGEEQVWKLLGVLDAGVSLHGALQGFTRPELLWLSRCLERLYRQTRDQILKARPELDEEEVFWGASKLVDQGREVWEGALLDPSAIRFEEVRDYQPVYLLINDLYRERYHDDLPA
ncbi:MAG: hypothetical protein KTR21_17170 [Rhodobacteraceae bacterium]|nr:hypothetical protein [Paracoccaceae bacterium]